MIKVALGIESGTLRGKALARRYWQVALEKVPDLESKDGYPGHVLR